MKNLEPCLIDCFHYMHAKFQDANGLTKEIYGYRGLKKGYTPSFSGFEHFIDFLLGQLLGVFFFGVFFCGFFWGRGEFLWQRKKGIDLNWKFLTDQLKFYIKYICYVLSHTYIKLRLTRNSLKQFLKCNT